MAFLAFKMAENAIFFSYEVISSGSFASNFGDGIIALNQGEDYFNSKRAIISRVTTGLKS
jgi:hypothetical protein